MAEEGVFDDEEDIEEEDELSDKDDEEIDSDEEKDDEDMFNLAHVNVRRTKDNGLLWSTDIMSPYERTRLIGMRASEIENGSPPKVDIKPKGLYTPIAIAIEEMLQKKFPLMLERPFGVVEKTGEYHVEIVDPNELILPTDDYAYYQT
jgi:DNA-directed RNA polymerase subunit K/omega